MRAQPEEGTLRKFLVAIAVVLGLAACAGPREDVRYAPGEVPDYNKVGVASWYGPGFQGRKTASGARFNMNALTAAHPSLPFGTQVRVTNVKNGRSVVVTINDRGPFARGRIIDLSKAAASRLGMIKQGVAKVRVEAIGRVTRSS